MLPMHEMEDNDKRLYQDQQRHDWSEDGQHRVRSATFEALDAVLLPHVKDLVLLQADQDGCEGSEQAGAAEEAVH